MISHPPRPRRYNDKGSNLSQHFIYLVHPVFILYDVGVKITAQVLFSTPNSLLNSLAKMSEQ
ncbi:hypothetical protein BDV09DRAFT_121242 [Aspergillus tetrazonus]